MKNAIALVLLLAALESGISSPLRAGIAFEFNLDKPAMTSAGIFTPDGKLVRVLWTMQNQPSGRVNQVWDGKDQWGIDAPPGRYVYKIAANRAVYRNVGAIGNSGFPPDPRHHTPAAMLSVAVDSQGGVYTANGWDEAGADFKKWDKDGTSLYDAEYQIRNGQPNGAPYSIAVDDQYIYCGMGGWADPNWKEAQQIQRFRRNDGKQDKFTKVNRADGHIQIYEWPSKQIPPGVSESQQELFKYPLRALAIVGNVIYCADALGNRILKFDKASGEARGEFKVDLPQAIAADSQGRLWIGHAHHLVTVRDTEGKVIAEPLKDLGEIEAISAGPRSRISIADSAAGCVKLFNADPFKPTLLKAIGQKAAPGDRDASRFYRIRGAAIGPDDSLTTIQTEPVCGARLAHWSADGKLLWEQFGCEFVSLGNYGAHDPTAFYSMTFHNYHLLDPNSGRWEYTGDGASGARHYQADVHGVPRVIKLGENTFYFLPSGDGVQVYRIDGRIFRLAALVGGRSPSPEGSTEGKALGQWSWHDAAGASDPKPEQITWFRKPGQGHYSVFGTDVDGRGNIWFANTETQSIWTIPIGPLDARGNPVYDWTQAREVIPKDATSLKFRPNMVQHADDGSFYAFGWSELAPEPKNNPFWMGGTTLVRFDSSGERLWAVKLPALCVGLDTIPGGGGCIAGQGDGAKIHHFTRDGLYVGVASPGEAMAKQSGWLDNHASIAVNRDPRDRMLDIFTEDDLLLRIGWYRVDDNAIQMLSGPLNKQ